MSRIFTATIIFAAALTFVLLAADKTREQTLQRAIDMLESKGDLAKAVPLFEDAARSSDRAVAARALLYLGGAQERQGNERARATYQRIVNEFGNQTETVAAAQKRLVALGVAGTPSVLAKRLLCADCGDQEADFSPDGRLMVFTDWESGDLATRDMFTGKVKRLMAKPGTIPGAWGDTEAYGESPVMSRDLRQIVYCWEPDEKEQRAQLRIMPNETGGKARVLVDNPVYEYYEPTAWSADGKSVLAILKSKQDRTQQIALVSVADGAVRVLKSIGWRNGVSSHPIFSPDGQYIVYHALAVNPSKSYLAATDPKDQHIYILAADGSSETEVVKTSGMNQFPVWTPDGKHILFISDRSGKFDLWSIAVHNGKAVGAASLVTPNLGTVDAAAMHGSSYYYTNDVHTEYVNIAEFAPGGRRRIAHATESFIGIQPAWSPDGKSIAVKRHHPGSVNAYDLVVHSLQTGDERTYLTDLGTSLSGGTVWFHDGKTVLTGINRSPYRVNLKTGEFAPLPAPFLPRDLSPDDKTLYVARYDPKDRDNLPIHILAVDLNNGQGKPVFTLPEPGNVWLQVTMDGRTIVVCRRDQKTRAAHFCRLNVDGTGYREIGTVAERDFRGFQDFRLTKDGQWILFAKRNNEDKNWQVVRIPIEGGAPESTGVEFDKTFYQFGGVDLSPDGSRIAFTTSKGAGEIWTIDNILSVLK